MTHDTHTLWLHSRLAKALPAGATAIVGVAVLDLVGLPLQVQIGSLTAVAAVAVTAGALTRDPVSRTGLLCLAATAAMLGALRFHRLDGGLLATMLGLVTALGLIGAGQAFYCQQALSRHRQGQLVVARHESAEQERRRMARDLHDGPLQDLALLRLELLTATSGALLPSSSSADRVDELDRLCRSAGEALAVQMLALRATIDDLRPQVLEDLGLSAALVQIVDRLAQNTDLHVRADLQYGRRLALDCGLALSVSLRKRSATAVSTATRTGSTSSCAPRRTSRGWRSSTTAQAAGRADRTAFERMAVVGWG